MGVDIIFHRPQEGDFSSSDIRLGSRGDSFYEYLLCVFYAVSQSLANIARRKQYIQTVRVESFLGFLCLIVRLEPNRTCLSHGEQCALDTLLLINPG